ncbi:MAG: pyridoxamine 5'-phosphate oxidase family protein [Gemmatimonadaceae bacterium]
MTVAAFAPQSSLQLIPALGILEPAECEALLKRTVIGRLAFTLHDRVSIVPISYVYDEGWIYGRTEPAEKLVPILRNEAIRRLREVRGARGIIDRINVSNDSA